MRVRLLFVGLTMATSLLLAGCGTTSCCGKPASPPAPSPCCGQSSGYIAPVPATSGFVPARPPIIATVPGPTAP
jgi:hypothetical protein